MRVLGIETATAICAAAVVEHGRTLAEQSIEAPHIHSERLMSLIDQSLHSAGVDVSAIDGLAISIGPGSFTGLRIGLSVAKGLAYAVGKPIVAVPTLEALSYCAVKHGAGEDDQFILPMIDARRDEVYAGLYRWRRGKLEEVIPPRSLILKDYEELLPVSNKRVVITGNGTEKFQQYVLKNNVQETLRFVFPRKDSGRCSAVTVALLGEEKLTLGEVSDVSTLEPLYVKDFHTLVKTQHPAVTL